MTVRTSMDWRFVRSSRAAGLALLAIGLPVLASWWIAPAVLGWMGSATTKPNTALGLILLGALFVVPARAPAVTGRVIALVLVVLAAASLLEYLVPVDLRIDGILAPRHSVGPAAGRMSALTAVAFLLLGLAALWRDAQSALAQRATVLLGLAVFVVALFRLLGIIFEAEAYVSPLVQVNGMALPTTLGLLIAASAMLASRPALRPIDALAAETSAGYHARRLVGLSIPLVVLVAVLAQLGRTADWYNDGFRGAALGAGVLLLTSIATWRTFERLGAEESKARAALAALDEARRTLERTVHERTAQLRDANEALQRSEEPLRLLVESTRDFALLLLDPDGRILSWNPGAERIKQYRADEAVGRHFSMFYEPAALAAGLPERALATAAQDGRTIDEGWRLRKDGVRFWASVVITALRKPDGTLIGFFKITQDLTERRAAEEALRLSERRLSIALDNAGVGLWDWSITNGTVWFDRNYSAILGYGDGELPTRIEALQQLVHPEDRAGVQEAIQRYLANPVVPFSVEYRRFLRDGGWIWVSSRGRVVDVDDAGAPSRMMGTIQDITERRRAAEAIMVQNRDLQNLLHVTSHDLREPLRGIKGFARLLDELAGPRLDEREADYLRRLTMAAARLDVLLDDITLLARVRQFELPTEATAGREFVDEALSRLEERIRQTGATVRVAEALPPILANRLWATQAIYNLVLNALKFTSGDAAPEIDVEPLVMPNETGIVVRDRGPGVVKEYEERIFELFQRAVGRSVEGTGAGLAIVRQVAARHGGRAWYSARLGGGSNFHITFRQRVPTPGSS